MNIEKLREWVKKLKEHKGKLKLDMSITRFHKLNKHLCGTPACHAGLAGALLIKKVGVCRTYSDGADALARFLGFRSKSSLEWWAGDNPKIWGNIYGSQMFLRGLSINDNYYNRESPYHWKNANFDMLVAKWEGVLERMEKQKEV